jgi:hypothetical protein
MRKQYWVLGHWPVMPQAQGDELPPTTGGRQALLRSASQATHSPPRPVHTGHWFITGPAPEQQVPAPPVQAFCEQRPVVEQRLVRGSQRPQATPPVPHSVRMRPAAHVDALLQQPRQPDFSSHTHRPARHRSPSPHAALVPQRHWPLATESAFPGGQMAVQN